MHDTRDIACMHKGRVTSIAASGLFCKNCGDYAPQNDLESLRMEQEMQRFVSRVESTMPGPSCAKTLADSWAWLAEQSQFPMSYDGDASVEVYQAMENMQELLQGHVIDQNDMRLVGLLHLLGQAARRMESELWPDADKAGQQFPDK